jgi:outer membrane protein
MKYIFLLSAAALLSVNLFCQAQLKIGHVNYDEIMLALPARDSAQAILDKESKELQAGYEELTVTYNKMYDDYQKGLAGFSATVRKLKEDELMDKQKRISDYGQNASAAIQKRNTELLTPIIEKINKAINKVALDNGFTYILDISKGSVVYTAPDSQNINPLVLKVLSPAGTQQATPKK